MQQGRSNPEPQLHTLSLGMQALAVGVGPLAGGWEAAAAALKAAKTDISKPVREAAAAAMPMLSEVLAFLSSGVPAEQWPAVCGGLLAAEAGGGKRLMPGGATVPKAAAGNLSLKVAAPEEPAGAGQFIPALHGPAAPATLVGGRRYSVQPRALPPPGVMPHPPGVPPPLPAVPTGGGVPYPSDTGSQLLAAQLAAVLERQARLEAAFGFSASAGSSLQRLQQHLAGVSSDVAALAASGRALPGGQQAVGGGGGAVAGVEPGEHGSSSSSSTPGGHPKRLSSLHRLYNALEQDLHTQQHRQSPAASGPAAPAGSPSPEQQAAALSAVAGQSATRA